MLVYDRILIDNIDSFGTILWCFMVVVSSYFYDTILINEYETKHIWMNELIHAYQSGHCGEFEFHSEEYNPICLFCRNYDGEYGRTIIVSLAEHIVYDQRLHTIHEIKHSHTQCTTHHNHCACWHTYTTYKRFTFTKVTQNTFKSNFT